MPVIPASVGGMSVLSTLISGNSKECVITSLATDQEVQHIRRSLPDSVNVVRLQDRSCTTPGNMILCNDYVALVSEQFDKFQNGLSSFTGVETSLKNRSSTDGTAAAMTHLISKVIHKATKDPLVVLGDYETVISNYYLYLK